MRKRETEIRRLKDERMAFSASGNELDAVRTQREIDIKLKEYRKYCADNGLETKSERTNVEGYKRISVADKKLTDFHDSDKTELHRNRNHSHRRLNSEHYQIIDKATYNKLTKSFKKQGGLIIRGEFAKNHLRGHAYASYIPDMNVAYIRDDATVSDVLEEMYHAEQDRIGKFGKTLTTEVYLLREIDAQEYLLSVTKRYKIPKTEIEITKANLESYQKQLIEIKGGSL